MSVYYFKDLQKLFEINPAENMAEYINIHLLTRIKCRYP